MVLDISSGSKKQDRLKLKEKMQGFPGKLLRLKEKFNTRPESNEIKSFAIDLTAIPEMVSNGFDSNVDFLYNVCLIKKVMKKELVGDDLTKEDNCIVWNATMRCRSDTIKVIQSFFEKSYAVESIEIREL